MAKHLLGLIKWQVSTVERKINPCLGFVPEFLNNYENEASFQIPICSRHTTICFIWGRSSRLLLTHLGSWLYLSTPRDFVKTDWLWLQDRLTRLSDILKSLLQAEYLLRYRLGAGWIGKHPKGWLPTCSHLLLFMCVHSDVHVDFPSTF